MCRITFLGLLAITPSLGCGESGQEPMTCSDNVALTISSESTPIFTGLPPAGWPGACVTPPETIESVAPSASAAGTTYQVDLYVASVGAPEPLVFSPIASERFVP